MSLIKLFGITILTLATLVVNASDTIRFLRQNPAFPIPKATNDWSFDFSLPFLEYHTDTIQQKVYYQIDHPGFGSSLTAGEPVLPVMSKLFSVPKGVVPFIDYSILAADTFSLPLLSADIPIIPSIGSVQKKEPMAQDKRVPGVKYQKDAYLDLNPITLKFHGTLRQTDVYEIIYTPVAYNPVKGSLIAHHQVKASIMFMGSTEWQSQWQPLSIRQNAFYNQNQSKTNSPPETYLIVSFPEFDAVLAPFIKWKTQQGYRVHVANVGQQIGTASRTDIKAYLETWYNSPPAGFEPPTYVLLIGDVDRIAAWPGQTDTHATDLPYAEYTGDFLPEVFVGRFSAKNSEELSSIVEKNLWMQRNLGVETGFRNRHLLISGVDASYAPKYGNGAINYFTSYYSKPENGVDASYYLYGSGSPIVSNSQAAREAILTDFSAGNGTVYYTAHCSASGWSNPVFNNSDVANLTNYQMYPVVTGNCCHSLAFGGDSFGEQLVKAKDKGAVAYIGASDYSYWDEDYYWAIGYTNSITALPKYESTGLGAWDAWWHLNHEPENQQAHHIGEYIWFGNMAVMASASTLKNYYWEIYNLMGDPSLVPAKKQYNKVPHTPVSAMTGGQSELSIETVSGAKVTLFQNSSLTAMAKADANGLAHLNFEPLAQIGLNRIELVISHPEYAPFIDTLDVIAPNTPFIIFEGTIINDSATNHNGQPEYGESFALNVTITNYGTLPAKNIRIALACADAGIQSFTLHSDTAIAWLNPGESISTDDLAKVSLKNNVPNHHLLNFEGHLTYSDSLTLPLSFTLSVNAPELIISSVQTDVSGIGNLDGFLTASENASLSVSISNVGNAQVSNTLLYLTSQADTALMVLTPQVQVGDLLVQQSQTQPINVAVADSIFPGSSVNLNYTLVSGLDDQYQFTGSVSVKLGIEPSINMSNDSHTIASARFYDSGGPAGKYSSKENYTKTFHPYKSNYGLSADFSSFDVESSNSGICFDKLMVYDGPTVESPLIGTFCNANKPKTIVSQNPNGALTFRFISDGDVVKTGWEAQINSQPHYTVTFLVLGATGALPNANISFLNKSYSTDSAGLVSFNYIPQNNTKAFQISHSAYFDFIGSIGTLSSDTLIEVFMTRYPKLTFSLVSENSPVKQATVNLNGQKHITDSLGITAFQGIKPGYYSYSVSKKGYADTAGSISIETTDINSVLTLTKLPVFAVKFSVTNPQSQHIANASIQINDTMLLTDTQGEASLSNLVTNWYPFSITCKGYLSHAGTLFIDTTDIDSTLILNEQIYTVEFKVQHQSLPVPDALILLLDTVLTTNSGGVAILSDLPGDYFADFEIKASGFAPYHDQIMLSDTNQTKLVELVPLSVATTNTSSITVFPNPAKRGTPITIIGTENITSITLFDLNGIAHALPYKGNNNFIITTYLNEGIYILQIQSELGIYTHKLFIYP